MQKRILYVLIRDDLDKPYQAVQAGHAVAQYLLDYPGDSWQNSYLIYLNVSDLKALEFWKWKAEKHLHTVAVSSFCEPDLNNELTAIAVRCDDGKMFSKLRLMK